MLKNKTLKIFWVNFFRWIWNFFFFTNVFFRDSKHYLNVLFIHKIFLNFLFKIVNFRNPKLFVEKLKIRKVLGKPYFFILSISKIGHFWGGNSPSPTRGKLEFQLGKFQVVNEVFQVVTEVYILTAASFIFLRN